MNMLLAHPDVPTSGKFRLCSSPVPPHYQLTIAGVTSIITVLKLASRQRHKLQPDNRQLELSQILHFKKEVQKRILGLEPGMPDFKIGRNRSATP